MSYIILLFIFICCKFNNFEQSNCNRKFFRLMDHPIVNRSIHDKPIPKIGGLLIFVNILAISFYFNIKIQISK